ncbi:MAG TPA: hypothetical protein VIP70_10920 [Nitrososphaeraceae archaeon]
MTIVDTFSVIIGSAVILTALLGSIAVKGIRKRRTTKKNIILAIDSKWQKIKIAS